MRKLFGKTPHVVGIACDEFNSAREKIQAEYDATQAQHKKPTEYMRGLQYAIDILSGVEAHEL